MWGDILSTVGVFSTVGDIMSTVGGYLEYRGGCSVPWGDIMMHVGGYHVSFICGQITTILSMMVLWDKIECNLSKKRTVSNKNWLNFGITKALLWP